MDWKNIVGTVAPALATALGGPLAGMAAQAVSNAVLGKPDGKDAEITEALAMQGTDGLLKLREANAAFEVRMRELDIDLENIASKDRDSARRREVDAKDSWTPRALAGVVVGGFFIMAYMLISGQVTVLKDPVAAGVVGTLIGYVSAKADTVIGYYFGSSASSKAKDDVIGQKLNKV